MPNSVIILFLDGVGLGAPDPEFNPFMHVEMKTIQSLLGISHLAHDAIGTATERACLLGLDARLGVAGLPQSGTGQTMILTGLNAASKLGRHYGPYPNEALKAMLAQDSLFQTLREAGQPVAYANAYPDRFLGRLKRGKGRLSANTHAARLAGLRLRDRGDLQRGRALSALFSNEFWPEPAAELPPLSAFEAGQQLVALALDYRLTFFEFWYSDLVGHRQDRPESFRVLRLLDNFLGGIVSRLNRENCLLLVVSDHGNFEDWSTKKHTANPSLTMLVGDGAQEAAATLRTLVDVKAAVLAYLGFASEL